MIIAIISHRATCAQLAGISTEISTWWFILHHFVSVHVGECDIFHRNTQ